MQRKIPKLARLAAGQIPHTLFPTANSIITKNLAPTFVQHVVDANWIEISKMLAKTPLIMFEIIDIEDIEDLRLPSDSKISGLGYALLMGDRYTLDIFRSALSETHKQKYNDIVTSYKINANSPTREETTSSDGYAIFQSLVDCWLNEKNNSSVDIDNLRKFLVHKTHEMSQQHGIYCLQPYYWVTEVWLQLFQRRNNDDPLISNRKLNEFWQKIDGFAKKHLLPRHMLKQLLAKELDDRSYYWRTDGPFHEEEHPIDLHIWDMRKLDIKYMDINYNAHSGDIFGETYSISRGRSSHATLWATRSGIWMPNTDLFDMMTFRHLIKVRRLEIMSEQKRILRCTEQTNPVDRTIKKR